VKLHASKSTIIENFKMFLVYFTIGLVLLFIVDKIIKYRRHSKALDAFPMFEKQFLFAHIAYLGNYSAETFLKVTADWHQKLGNVFVIRVHEFDRGVIYVADPKIAEILANHQADRTEGLFYKGVAKTFGTGSFLSSNNKRMRFLLANVSSKMFSFEVANRYSNKAVEMSKRFEGPTNFYTLWKHLMLDFVFGENFVDETLKTIVKQV
jgi:hypothetical protein